MLVIVRVGFGAAHAGSETTRVGGPTHPEHKPESILQLTTVEDTDILQSQFTSSLGRSVESRCPRGIDASVDRSSLGSSNV
jgi:hypothetical protein